MENDVIESGQQSETTEPVLEERGHLERDKLYAGKYKTAEELEKGYRESSSYITTLRKQIQENKAPESYDLSSFSEKIDSNDESIKAVLQTFKEVDISQEKANKILETYISQVEASKIDPEEEKRKLGVNAEEIVSKLSSFSEKLNDKDRHILESLTDTAENVDFLYRYLVGTQANIPVGVQRESKPLKTGKELIAEAMAFKEQNINSIGFDTEKQAHYERLLEEGVRLQSLGK